MEEGKCSEIMNEWVCGHWLLSSIIEGYGFSKIKVLPLQVPEGDAHNVVSRDHSCLVSFVWFTYSYRTGSSAEC